VLELVITGATLAAEIVIVKDAVPVPVPLVALSVTTEVPAVVGVPVIVPKTESTPKPAGRPVAL
jgi:hypothetical protein